MTAQQSLMPLSETMLRGSGPKPNAAHPIPWQLGVGALLALACVTAVVTAARLSSAQRAQTKDSVQPRFPSAASWSFSDSWASNLTALIAGVAALGVAVSDNFPTVVRKSSLLEFAVGSAALAVIAVLAPIAYTALSIAPAAPDEASADEPGPPRGSGPGLLAAAFLTLTGTFGSLAGVVAVIADAEIGDLARGVVIGGCCVAALLVIVYALTTLRCLLDVAAATSGASLTAESFARLTGMVNVSCCGSTPEAVRVRVSLL